MEGTDSVNLPQPVENLYTDLFSIPWGHHRYIIDKCSNDADKALFFVRQTILMVGAFNPAVKRRLTCRSATINQR